MRCERCGNNNSDANRFCGMCGAPLVERTPVTQAPVAKQMPENLGSRERRTEQRVPGSVVASRGPAAQADRSIAPPVPSSAAPTATRVERIVDKPVNNPGVARPVEEPIISGPSFLGLNKAAPSSTQQASGVRDRAVGGRYSSAQSSSGNLAYLLEDDEEEPRRGWGKLAAILVALILAVGLGYLNWRQGGFDWLKRESKNKQSTESSPGSAGTAAPTDAGSPSSTPSSSASGGAPSSGATPAGNSGPTDGSAPAAQPVTPANGSAADAAATGVPANSASPSPVPDSAGGSDGAAATSPPASNASPTPSPVAATAQATDSEATDESAAPTSEVKPSPSKPKPGRAQVRERKPTPVTQADPAVEAERYLYGRGVPQDCDRGLRLLKPAAERSNAKAMISLGRLYSNGTCTPRDLPTAYRWFALALHKEPENQPLQNDLQKLWSQMTQPERQLAIKLSQ